jgi:hypothetical protein
MAPAITRTAAERALIAIRSAALLHIAFPLAWVALGLVRALAGGRGDLMASVVGRSGADLADVQADARWWLSRSERVDA